MALNQGDPGLHDEHTPEAIRRRISASKQHSYLGDFVLGSIDGTVTTFAIVAGAAGAGLSSGVAVVLGLANVVADGFSMAVSNYLKADADRQIVERFRRMEENHIDEIPDGEREEIRQIFAGKGFEGETLEEIVKVVTNDRNHWVNTMLVEEWGLQIETPSPLRSGWVTFVAFVLAGMVPLVPLFFAVVLSRSQLFSASALLTLLTFFGIGVIRGRLSDQNPWWIGLQTLLVGGAAAALAFTIGRWLQGWAQV